MNKLNLYPKIGQAIVLTLFCFFLQIVFGTIAGIFMIFKDTPSFNGIITLISILCTASTVLLGIYLSKVPIINYYKHNKTKLTTILFSILLFLGFYFINIYLSSILQNIIPQSNDFDDLIKNEMENTIGIISIVILAPIFEEMLFRGIILRGFLKNYSSLKAIIISAVLFGFLHFNPIQSIITALIGMLLGFIFVKTGSLLLCIFLHALNNGIVTLLYYLSKTQMDIDGIFNFLFVPIAILAIISFIILIKRENNISFILQEKQLEIERFNQFQESIYYSQNTPNNAGYNTSYISNQNISYNMSNAINYNIAQNTNLNNITVKKSSSFGIAAFVIAILTSISYFITFSIMNYILKINNLPLYLTIILFLVLVIPALITSITGLILGFRSLKEINKNKAMGIIGVLLNIIIIICNFYISSITLSSILK